MTLTTGFSTVRRSSTTPRSFQEVPAIIGESQLLWRVRSFCYLARRAEILNRIDVRLEKSDFPLCFEKVLGLRTVNTCLLSAQTQEVPGRS